MKCAVCGKPIKTRPRLFHRQTGERVCRDCFNVCYHSEEWIKNGNDPEAAGGVLSYKDESGLVMIRCGIKQFFERLYELEERYKPEFRFTRRNEETGRIDCRHPVFFEAMLERLYEYEHPRRCAVCEKPVERVHPCPYYTRRGEVTCDECCEECYRTEPFPCREHDARVRENRRKNNADRPAARPPAVSKQSQ